MLFFLIVVAFIAWFVYLCVTWGRPPKKRKYYPQSLAPLPPPSQPLTPEQISLVVVLAQTLAQPHHH